MLSEKRFDHMTYSKVMGELRILFTDTLCYGNKCRFYPFIGAEFIRPVLHRATHEICKCTRPTSEYGHKVCYSCADKDLNPVEFEYHHKWCQKN